MQILTNIFKPTATSFLLLLLLFFIQPMISIVIIAIYLPLIYKENKIYSHLLFFIIIAFVIFVNATKIPQADLNVYYHWFEELKGLSFLDALKVKATDPIFTYITSILTIFYYNKVFIIFWNGITVLFMYFSVLKVNKFIGNKDFICAQLFMMIFYFVQPEHISHTTRAFASVSCMILGYCLFLESKKTLAIIFVIFSIGIHSSSILLLGLFLGSRLCIPFLIFSLFVGYANVSNFITLLSSFLNISFITEQVNYYQYRSSDTEQYVVTSYQMFIFYIELFVVLLMYIYNKIKIFSSEVKILLSSYIYVGSLIILFHKVPLFSVRMYLYHNYFFCLCLSVFWFFTIRKANKYIKLLIGLLLCCISLLLYLYKFNYNTQWIFLFYNNIFASFYQMVLM
ncbi:TPA: EpsG family protein [Photobacterium damselae]